jgi:hypothetical protein
MNEQLTTLRLLLEGAIALYQDDAMPLFKLGLTHKAHKAAIAFDDIGGALYALRNQIISMQLSEYDADDPTV